MKLDRKHLTYLTLEAPRQGSASYTHIHEIIKGLEKRGWCVKLVRPSYADKQASPSLLLRLIYSFLLQIQLWAKWSQGSVLYVRAHYLAFPSVFFARLLGIPVFHEINGPYEDVFITHPSLKIFKRILIWIQRTQFRWASGLIAVTDQLKEYAYQESNGVPCVVIPNGANIDLFNDNVDEPNEKLPENFTIFFGGLAAWHGVQVMLDALQSDIWPKDVHLVVIGDGPEKEKLMQPFEKNYHLLHFLGARPYQQIPSYIRGAICGLIPILNPDNRSSTGVFPLKLFETLACGVPVIVTNFPGQADLVREHECGLVILENDSLGLAKAVKYLYENEDERKEMGKIGARLIIESHSWDRRAMDTHNFIETIISGQI